MRWARPRAMTLGGAAEILVETTLRYAIRRLGIHMPNDSVIASCKVPGQQNPEGIALTSDKRWKSPPGGWLAAQSGTWTQVATVGVKLSATGIPNLALLQGMVFDTAETGDSGTFRYDHGGDAGRWECIDTLP